jgi:hypothetical protein
MRSVIIGILDSILKICNYSPKELFFYSAIHGLL